MDVSNYRDLLIVNVSEKLYVVDAPAHEADTGNLVEFDKCGVPTIGTVVDKMWCDKTEEVYRCVGRVLAIHPAQRIYKSLWAAEEQAEA